MYTFESKRTHEGYRRIAGTDEAGRGPLAGPLVAAAVILDPARPIEGLADSKTLPESVREVLYAEIIEKAVATSIVFVDVETIDKINIYRAAQKAMTDAVCALAPAPDAVLTDAMPLPGVGVPCQPIVGGDKLSASIAAASILAKVERDRHMVKLAKCYPDYGFDAHKGYPTKAHFAALQTFGPSPVHRRSFKPVKRLLQKQQKLAL